MMSAWKLPLFALSLITLMGTAAYAQDQNNQPQNNPGAPAAMANAPVTSAAPPTAPTPPTPPVVEAPAATPVPTPAPAAAATAPESASPVQKELTPDDLAKMKQEHEARYKAAHNRMHAQHESLKDLSPEKREAMQQSLVEWFKSLTLEEQYNLKRRSEFYSKKAAKTETKAAEEHSAAAPATPAAAPVPAPAPAPMSPPAAPVPPAPPAPPAPVSAPGAPH